MSVPHTPLEKLKHVHIVGVGGTLMGAFAALLKRRGIRVTGTDGPIYPPMSDVLAAAGVEIFTGYKAENLTSMLHKPDLVVIGNVIRRDNPEAQAALNGGYEYASLPEMMERFMLSHTRNLVVAGTHGKTTSSSLLSYTLVQCGLKPNYFIGGILQDLPHSFHVDQLSQGTPFVLEGDEYDTAFWDKVPKFNHYLPDDTILTSVEYDHADIYPDFPAVVRAFEGLVSRVRPGGRMIACVDSPVIRELMLKSKVPVIGYGLTAHARYTPANIRTDGAQTRFEIRDAGKTCAELMIQLPGEHNVLNALAVWIECRELGIAPDKIKAAFASFRGVKRRQEERGEKRGVLVIDDFAHHPTAVRETLKALKARYPERRLIAVFEPRSATSRRKVFQKDYAEAFLGAAAVFIAKPYDQSLIASNEQFSSEELIADLQRNGLSAELFTDVEQGVACVAQFAKAGDLVAVLSNGGFGGFIVKLLNKL